MRQKNMRPFYFSRRLFSPLYAAGRVMCAPTAPRASLPALWRRAGVTSTLRFVCCSRPSAKFGSLQCRRHSRDDERHRAAHLLADSSIVTAVVVDGRGAGGCERRRAAALLRFVRVCASAETIASCVTSARWREKRRQSACDALPSMQQRSAPAIAALTEEAQNEQQKASVMMTTRIVHGKSHISNRSPPARYRPIIVSPQQRPSAFSHAARRMKLFPLATLPVYFFRKKRMLHRLLPFVARLFPIGIETSLGTQTVRRALHNKMKRAKARLKVEDALEVASWNVAAAKTQTLARHACKPPRAYKRREKRRTDLLSGSTPCCRLRPQRNKTRRTAH